MININNKKLPTINNSIDPPVKLKGEMKLHRTEAFDCFCGNPMGVGFGNCVECFTCGAEFSFTSLKNGYIIVNLTTPPSAIGMAIIDNK